MGLCPIYHFHLEPVPKGYSFFDIGKRDDYFKPIEPFSLGNSSLIEALQLDKNLRATCYFSGTFLEALRKEDLENIKLLVESGKIELLAGTYHDSFSSLLSQALFDEELKRYKKQVKKIFGIDLEGFLNTAGLFSNDLVPLLVKSGFKYAVVPRVPWFQGDYASNRVFQSKVDPKLSLLLMGDMPEESNKQKVVIQNGLSHSIAFSGEETLVGSAFIKKFQAKHSYSLPNLVMMDDQKHEQAHFFGNALQKQLFQKLRDLVDKVLQKKDSEITDLFLQFASAGQFSKISQETPQEHRYHHYNWLINCLTDLELRIDS